MKKLTLALSATLLLGASSMAQAQTEDVNFTIAPATGYTWWSKNVNLGESAHWGVRAGFSFGKMFEIRGIYDRSFDLKGKLSSSSWNAVSSLSSHLEGSDAKMERLGGEMRLSLLKNTAIVPYLTVGGGVITFKHDALTPTDESYKEEQLYAALGAGVKIRLADRVGLSLEAKDNLFNLSEGSHYRNPAASSGRVLNNWSAQASLDVYLGGTKTDNDPVSRAYRAKYSGGLRGLKFTVEPGVSYIDFSNSSLMHDQWLVGGALGVDFSNVLGLRGFYYTSTQEPNKLNFDLNTNVQMYGANVIGRLNYLRGLTPYLTLGGGFMDVRSSNYTDTKGTNLAKSGWFAMGGAGLEIPLHKYVSLYGNVNLLFLEQDHEEVTNLYTPSQVNFSTMYQAGVRINIGSSGRSGRTLYRDFADAAVARQQAENQDFINELRAKQEAELREIRESYDQRLAALDQELVAALAERDTLRVLQLSKERDEVEVSRTQVVREQAVAVPLIALEEEKPERQIVTLSQSQLEELIARVVAEVKVTNTQQSSLSTLSDLDKILLFTALNNGQLQQAQLQAYGLGELLPLVPQRAQTQEQVSDKAVEKLEKRAEELLGKIDQLQRQLDRSQQTEAYRAIESQYLPLEMGPVQRSMTVVQTTAKDASSTQVTPESMHVIAVDENGKLKQKEYTLTPKRALNLNGVQVFTGFNVGDATNWVVGLRPQWQIKDSRFYLAPEAFYGFGNGGAFGLSANALYKFKSMASQKVSPYLGVGLGYTRIDAKSRLNTNVILGASFDNILGGRFTVDYTVRGLFRNNQFTAGYIINL